MGLRVLLAALGFLMAAKSRWSRSFRNQLTRDVVMEISSDDGVARHFVFRDRRVSSHAGRIASPDCALRFTTADRGFAILTAGDGPTRLMGGLFDGGVRLEGRTALFAWFQGLVAAVVPGTPTPRLPATPPGAYVTPSSSPEVSSLITREPAVRELDPAWTAAARAREKLAMSRVAMGERPKLF